MIFHPKCQSCSNLVRVVVLNNPTVRIGHLLHKVGALSQCDPVLPRGQGISLSEHMPGRDIRQGLTLIHFSAQPEPFLTQNAPCTPPDNP